MWGVEQVSRQLSPRARGMVETSWGACVHQLLAAHFLHASQDGLHTSELTSCPGRAPQDPHWAAVEHGWSGVVWGLSQGTGFSVAGKIHKCASRTRLGLEGSRVYLNTLPLPS